MRHRSGRAGIANETKRPRASSRSAPQAILRVTQFCVTRKLDTLNFVTIVENRPGCPLGPPEGLRERKKAATRQALGIAAMRLAIERGLDNVHPEDIAAEAGVSTRTFNNYFASKYEAICALAMERGTIIGAALRSRPAGEPLMDAITAAVLEPYVRGERPPDRDWVQGVRLVIKSASLEGEYLRAQRATQKVLAQAIADRIGADPATDMFPAVMAGAVTAAVHVAHERWMAAEPPVPLVPLIRLALSQLRYPCGDTPRANSLAIGPQAADPDQALRPADY